MPEKFIKARESDLRRIRERTEIRDDEAINARADEAIRRTARPSESRSDTLMDMLDIVDFTDLFS